MKPSSILTGVVARTAAAALATTFAGIVSAGPESCETRVNNTHHKLQECVTLDGVRQHQAALQAIADANNGIRTSGTPGYDRSMEYVRDRLIAAGYLVSVQPFQFQTFIGLSPSILEQVAPPPAGPIPNEIFTYSGSGDVTAAVTALTAPPADATPGCEAADFAGFPVGNIALISRGGCTFAIKATNAYSAGASGVVIYNNTSGPINGTLGNTFTLDIAVTSVTQGLGQQLAATPNLVLRLATDTFRGIATTYNVLAETPDGDPDNVVMAGAHLDSVNAGPGINDNGSGSAAILETALQMAKVKPRNKVRFAWWGAEESSLVGSTYYMDNLPQDERDRIALYLNFDMVGSPNHVFFIYDGDDSDGIGAGPGPAGSAEIEKLYEFYFTARGIPFKGTDFSGRSDYGPFIAAGIPAGGLFTGAEGIKTAAEAALWGGTAGLQYDPCYHQACDTYANNNDFALGVNAGATAFSVLHFAMSTERVNGVRGKGNFNPDHWGPRAIK
jgi:aminopeptidase Y